MATRPNTSKPSASVTQHDTKSCLALSFPFTIHTPAHIPFRPHPRSCRLGCVGGTVCRSNAWQHIWAGPYASCAVRKADLPPPTHPTTTLNPFSPNTYSFRPTCSRPTAGHTNNPCGRRPFRPDPIVVRFQTSHLPFEHLPAERPTTVSNHAPIHHRLGLLESRRSSHYMILLWTTPPPPQASPLHGAQLTVDTSNWDQRLLRYRGADSRPPMSIQPHNRTARTASARPANKSIPGATNVNMMECQSAPAHPGGMLSRRNTNPDVGVPVRGGVKPPEVAMAVRGGTETPGVNAPIFEGHDDANDRFPACEKRPIHPETTGGHCKKKTKGGSSRRIKEGDVVSCASTEFDGDQPGSWSDGKQDRTHGVVTHISKEGIVMVHWYDDNTNFAVKMKNLRREAEKAPEAISRSPTTVSNEKSATTNRPNADFANDKERQAGRGRKRDRSGRNQSGRKQDRSGRNRSGRKQVRVKAVGNRFGIKAVEKNRTDVVAINVTDQNQATQPMLKRLSQTKPLLHSQATWVAEEPDAGHRETHHAPPPSKPDTHVCLFRALPPALTPSIPTPQMQTKNPCRLPIRT